MFRSVRRSIVLVAALTASMLVASTATAEAATYQPPQISFVSDVVVTHGRVDAYLVATYRCYGGSKGTHVWVSVKQGLKLSWPDHTSSAYADAWADTNWYYGVNPAGLTANCNGTWQTAIVPMKDVFGKFVNGTAFVQVCVYDSTADPNDEESTKGFGFNYSVKKLYQL